MIKKFLSLALLLAATMGINVLKAQDKPFFNELKFEARTDFIFNQESYNIQNAQNTNYGFQGRYFNLHMGGNLTNDLSYYFRQRIIANPGSSSLFDNTDFLWLNYQINKNWSIRGGKDALAYGGFEYDARPIDVLYCGYYWDWFYCFQLGASGSYTTNDGNHKFTFQVANSPYHFSANGGDQKNILSYNLMWAGNMGHFQTLYSINWFDVKEGKAIPHIALGNKLSYDSWDAYLDIIERYNGSLGNNFSIISRINYRPCSSWTVFFKGGWERNFSTNEEILHMNQTFNTWDIMSQPHKELCFYGLGCEFRPEKCRDIRLHAYVAEYDWFDQASKFDVITEDISYIENTVKEGSKVSNLQVNFGLTWDINILNYLHRK